MRRRPSGHSPGLLGVQALVLALAGAWELGAQQDRAAQTPEPPAFTLSAEEDIEGPLPDTPLTPAEVGSAAPWVHGLLGAGCLAVFAGLLLVRRAGPPTEVAADPFADLERDLQALPPGGDARTFHHGLSTALRRYLARRLSAPLLESTTRESNEVLRRQGMPDDSRREVVDLLALSDEARFAQRAVAAHRRQKRRARARRAARGVELWCRRREEAAAAREAQQRRSGP